MYFLRVKARVGMLWAGWVQGQHDTKREGEGSLMMG